MDINSEINNLFDAIPSAIENQAKQVQDKLEEVDKLKAKMASLVEELDSTRKAKAVNNFPKLERKLTEARTQVKKPQPIVEQKAPKPQNPQALYEDHLMRSVSQQISYNTRFDQKPAFSTFSIFFQTKNNFLLA